MIRVGDHSGDTHPAADSDLYLNADQLQNNLLVINNLKLATYYKLPQYCQ